MAVISVTPAVILNLPGASFITTSMVDLEFTTASIVTSGEDIAAQNFGLEKLTPRQQRYEMADEYVDLVCKLFDSWDHDAVVMDRASGTYTDYRNVPPAV